MRLRKLILQGFKSFADKTEFVFDHPVTCIVGPNGCGKSNVVDAVKWVLGEQSAKSLRGDAMLDVIFNGSSTRKPGGMAEVTLVFENPATPDGTRVLNLPTDEVAVGRRLYRDGTSEYTLNGHASRLKDIRELFLDTGVGVDAYSVIEQGRVARLLDSNPQERRLIFEEAAGISRFKVKKKETLRKLEKVDQNLLRVRDIVDEVDRRLRGVRVQAGRARTFQEHRARLDALRLAHVLQEYHALHTLLTRLEGERDQTQFRVDDIRHDLSRRQNELAGARESAEQAAGAKQQAEYALVAAKAAIQSARQKQQYATQQLEQVDEQVEQLRRDRDHAIARREEVADLLTAETARLAALSTDLQQKRQEIEQKQQDYRDGQLKHNALLSEIEQNKQRVLDVMRKLAIVNSRLASMLIEHRNVQQQQDRQAQRRRQVADESEQANAKAAGLRERIDAIVAVITRQRQQMETRRGDAADLGKQIQQTTDQLGSAREQRSGLVSRQKVLQDLETRREGVSEGVKAVLRQRDNAFAFILGIVADFVRVDVEHAKVIEAALNGDDQWLVAQTLDAAAAAREAFGQLGGRVNIVSRHLVPQPFAAAVGAQQATDGRGEGSPDGVAQDVAPPVDELSSPRATAGHTAAPSPATLPMNAAQPSLSQREREQTFDWDRFGVGMRFAMDLVRFEPVDAPVVDQLLGSTIVVDTLEDGLTLYRVIPGYRFVTRQGEVIEADGTLRMGPLTAGMGLLSRRSELEALAHQIADTDARITALALQVSTAATAAQDLEADINRIRGEIDQSNSQKVEATSHLARADDQLASLARELPLLDRELENLLAQFDKLNAEETRRTTERDQLDADQSAAQQQIDAGAAAQQELADVLRQVNEAMTLARVALGQVQEQQLGARQAVDRLTSQQAELSQQLDRLTRSIDGVDARRNQIRADLAAAAAAEQQAISRHDDVADEAHRLVETVKTAGETVRNLAAKVESIRGLSGELEGALHNLQVRLSEQHARRDALVARSLDEMQLDLPERYQAEVNAAKVSPAETPNVATAPNSAGNASPATDPDVAQKATDTATPPGQPGAPPGPPGTAPASRAYQPPALDWDAVAREIKDLKDKISRLGNVNLDAIGEMDELDQRQTFLATQVTDLTDSKRQLEMLIDEINRESSARFQQTFEATREHFQGLFRKLFGGGKADIYLETELEDKKSHDPTVGPDGQTLLPVMRRIDPLDAGIEIIARPPGKQPVSISQLSGGEKTMTCIALLMSIFKSKPSPFCILDEVDAALDEANNVRFGAIVQEFLDTSQFVVITHHKRTMQIADVLYGVTMQEQGVSKRVAVKFDQVEQGGRLTPAAQRQAATAPQPALESV